MPRTHTDSFASCVVPSLLFMAMAYGTYDLNALQNLTKLLGNFPQHEIVNYAARSIPLVNALTQLFVDVSDPQTQALVPAETSAAIQGLKDRLTILLNQGGHTRSRAATILIKTAIENAGILAFQSTLPAWVQGLIKSFQVSCPNS